MSIEEIEKFLNKKATTKDEYVKITFKKRDAIYGLFLKDSDYNDLKSKNFWRIVPQSQLDAYKASRNVNLAKIFNGAEFSRLTTYNDSFEQATFE
jgi:hypothetical protein